MRSDSTCCVLESKPLTSWLTSLSLRYNFCKMGIKLSLWFTPHNYYGIIWHPDVKCFVYGKMLCRFFSRAEMKATLLISHAYMQAAPPAQHSGHTSQFKSPAPDFPDPFASFLPWPLQLPPPPDNHPPGEGAFANNCRVFPSPCKLEEAVWTQWPGHSNPPLPPQSWTSAEVSSAAPPLLIKKNQGYTAAYMTVCCDVSYLTEDLGVLFK